MGRSILVVAHGMGSHTGQSVKEPAENNATAAFKRFKSHDPHNFKDFVDVHAIAYNNIFEKGRKELESPGSTLCKYFGGQESLIPRATIGEGIVNQSDFFKSQALDVLLYGSLHAEILRSRVAGRLSEIDSNRSADQSFHVLAHSLATVVLHYLFKSLEAAENNIKT